jgi:hypothetical protein
LFWDGNSRGIDMKTSVLSKITENEVFDLNVYQLVRPPIVHNNRFDVGLMIIKEKLEVIQHFKE